MTGIFSVLGPSLTVFQKLYDSIQKYNRKTRTKNYLVDSLQEECQDYIDSYTEVVSISEELIPYIKNITGQITLHHINRVLEITASLPLRTALWIDSFVNIARACDDVSELSVLMEHLKEDHPLLRDFVAIMKYVYDPECNKVTIDRKYFRFFKTYESAIFGKVTAKELTSTSTNDWTPVLKKVEVIAKNVKIFRNKRGLIKNEIKRKYERNTKQLIKSASHLSIDKNVVNNLSKHVPDKLLPAALLLEEFIGKKSSL